MDWEIVAAIDSCCQSLITVTKRSGGILRNIRIEMLPAIPNATTIPPARSKEIKSVVPANADKTRVHPGST